MLPDARTLRKLQRHNYKQNKLKFQFYENSLFNTYYCFTVPAPPLNVVAPDDEITATSIYVSWEEPQPVYGNILSHSLEYASSVQNGTLVNISGLTVNVTGLMEAVLYTITVYAHTDKGRGNGTVTMATTAEHCECMLITLCCL